MEDTHISLNDGTAARAHAAGFNVSRLCRNSVEKALQKYEKEAEMGMHDADDVQKLKPATGAAR